jgi:hypothetical protein
MGHGRSDEALRRSLPLLCGSMATSSTHKVNTIGDEKPQESLAIVSHFNGDLDGNLKTPVMLSARPLDQSLPNVHPQISRKKGPRHSGIRTGSYRSLRMILEPIWEADFSTHYGLAKQKHMTL